MGLLFIWIFFVNSVVYMLFSSTILYVPWSKVAILGMVIPPLIGILIINGYINPYHYVDDHPLLHGNNGSLDPGTYGLVHYHGCNNCLEALPPGMQELSGSCTTQQHGSHQSKAPGKKARKWKVQQKQSVFTVFLEVEDGNLLQKNTGNHQSSLIWFKVKWLEISVIWVKWKELQRKNKS